MFVFRSVIFHIYIFLCLPLENKIRRGLEFILFSISAHREILSRKLSLPIRFHWDIK